MLIVHSVWPGESNLCDIFKLKICQDKEEVDKKPSKDPSEKHQYGSGSRASELSAVPETEDHNSNNGSCSELSGNAISSQTDLRVATLEDI